jgi:phosphoribosyl 1,2-cyclic phosphodiesterase
MKVQFWGVRGSIPTPLTPGQVRDKIDEVVDRIVANDLASQESRIRFLNSLPPWLYGTTGGNTSCVEIILFDKTRLILDAGSGLRELGKFSPMPENETYHILMSHFHWDHIQGLPFFGSAFRNESVLHFYSPRSEQQQLLKQQMTPPFFPVTMEGSFTPKTYFHTIESEKPFAIGSALIDVKKMKHPGDSYAYAITEGKKKFIYATDVEITTNDFERTKFNINFFENASAIVLDAQYLVGEAIQKENWGHSPFCYAIDFADFWKIENLYLFHHEPSYDDERLNSIFTSAIWYADNVTRTHPKVILSTEDLVVDL